MFSLIKEENRMIVYLELEGERIASWGSSPCTENYVEMELPLDHPVLMDPINYVYRDGQLIEDNSLLLSELKNEKEQELNKACQQAILYGFTHVIDGIEYHFSFDMEAQFNFQGSQTLFSNGMIDEIMWTVRKEGEYTRVKLTKLTMDELTLAILKHKDSNISKFRDSLMPLVKGATSLDELSLISW